MNNSRLLQFFLLLATLSLSVYTLIVARELLIPLLIAIVIWYLIISINSAIQNLQIGRWKVPGWLAYIGSIICITIFVLFIFDLITTNIVAVINSLPAYQQKLLSLTDRAFTFFNVPKPEKFGDMFQGFNLISIASNAAQVVTLIIGNAGIIAIYVLFLLLEHNSFDGKLDALISDKQKRTHAKKIIKTVSAQIQAYVRIKTALSVTTALLSYAVMRSVGVDFAEFWALLIFLLNYIPTIGSIVATIFPCLLTAIQFESLGIFLFVALLLTAIQFTMGNIVEPKVIGKSVNLSGLVLILSLAVWGAIWGIVGMFLCVPIMVITTIILANFPKTRPIAIILSGRGAID